MGQSSEQTSKNAKQASRSLDEQFLLLGQYMIDNKVPDPPCIPWRVVVFEFICDWVITPIRSIFIPAGILLLLAGMVLTLSICTDMSEDNHLDMVYPRNPTEVEVISSFEGDGWSTVHQTTIRDTKGNVYLGRGILLDKGVKFKAVVPSKEWKKL